jgi:hypothetical protein
MVMVKNRARRRMSLHDAATSLAIDAGCLALSGAAGLVAFAMAWLLLKGGGII